MLTVWMKTAGLFAFIEPHLFKMRRLPQERVKAKPVGLPRELGISRHMERLIQGKRL